jgi:hypothetical protein
MTKEIFDQEFQPQQPLQHQSNKTIAKSTTIPTQKNPQQTLAV